MLDLQHPVQARLQRNSGSSINTSGNRLRPCRRCFRTSAQPQLPGVAVCSLRSFLSALRSLSPEGKGLSGSEGYWPQRASRTIVMFPWGPGKHCFPLRYSHCGSQARSVGSLSINLVFCQVGVCWHTSSCGAHITCSASSMCSRTWSAYSLLLRLVAKSAAMNWASAAQLAIDDCTSPDVR